MLGIFSTLAGVSAVNVAITEGLINSFKIVKGWAKQLISWVTPVILSVIGLIAQLGLFASYGTVTDWYAWVYTILTGVGLGLVSNGLYDIKGVQNLINAIKDLIDHLLHRNKFPGAVVAPVTTVPAEEVVVKPLETVSDTTNDKVDTAAPVKKRVTRKKVTTANA